MWLFPACINEILVLAFQIVLLFIQSSNSTSVVVLWYAHGYAGHPQHFTSLQAVHANCWSSTSAICRLQREEQQLRTGVGVTTSCIRPDTVGFLLPGFQLDDGVSHLRWSKVPSKSHYLQCHYLWGCWSFTTGSCSQKTKKILQTQPQTQLDLVWETESYPQNTL